MTIIIYFNACFFSHDPGVFLLKSSAIIIQLKYFKSKNLSSVDELRKGANKGKKNCTFFIISWKVEHKSPVWVPHCILALKGRWLHVALARVERYLNCVTYWQKNNFKTLGKLSPTTRLETSFDASGPTKSDDRHVIPEDPAVGVLPAMHDKVKLTVVEFEQEDPGLKWFLRIMSIMLLVCLLFLWIYYR